MGGAAELRPRSGLVPRVKEAGAPPRFRVLPVVRVYRNVLRTSPATAACRLARQTLAPLRLQGQNETPDPGCRVTPAETAT